MAEIAGGDEGAAGAGRGPSEDSSARADAGQFATKHPLAARLYGAAPDADLARTLLELEPAQLDVPALVEAIAASDRLDSRIAAARARLVVELARRPGSVESTEAEISTALSTTRRGAQSLLAFAWGLDASPALADALASGAISTRKAEVILRETDHLPLDDAARVHSQVLPSAPGLTAPQLRIAVRRADLVREPASVAARCAAATQERRIALVPAPDGMARVHAYMPAVDACTVMTALDAMTARPSPDDDRSPDARRVDALTALARRVLDTGEDPTTGGPLVEARRRRPHLTLTMDLPSVLGLMDTPAHLAGYGPLPAHLARALARDSSWAALVRDASGVVRGRSERSYRPSGGLAAAVTARDHTCTFPGCAVPASRADVDHVRPYRAQPQTGAPGDGATGGQDTSPQTALDNLQALCRTHHRLKTHEGWQVTLDPLSGVTTWTTPSGQTRHRRAADPTAIPAERVDEPP